MPNQVSRKNWLKQYKKYYTNILYVEYTGDLHQSVTDMDFTDDLPLTILSLFPTFGKKISFMILLPCKNKKHD